MTVVILKFKMMKLSSKYTDSKLKLILPCLSLIRASCEADHSWGGKARHGEDEAESESFEREWQSRNVLHRSVGSDTGPAPVVSQWCLETRCQAYPRLINGKDGEFEASQVP